MVNNILPEHVNEVREELSKVCVIRSEEITNRRMTFHVSTRLEVSARRRLDTEWIIIKKFCNPPFTMWADNTTYRFTLGCN